MLNENKEFGRLQAFSELDHWIIWTEKLEFEVRVVGINKYKHQKIYMIVVSSMARYELAVFYSRGSI